MKLNKLIWTLLILKSALAKSWRQAGVFQVHLLHVNDIHAHFEEINDETTRCHQSQSAAGQCFGGMSRMLTKIRQVRDLHSNVVLLNAGDYFKGTMWYTIFKYEPLATIGNMLNYTAMALGNHDFDDKIDGLVPFADMINYDLLAANLEEIPNGSTPELGDRVKPSMVVTMDGVKVGIIGYITTDTPNISNPDDTLVFQNDIESVRSEAERLKNEEGVEIMIALGHSGYSVDLILAQSIPEVDVVVGGHSHSFLFTGTPPSNEMPVGPYPTYVTQSSGKVVPVVQAFAYTKYLGHLVLNFDNMGELMTPVDGVGVSYAEPVLLDDSYAKDEAMEAALNVYRERLSYFYEVVGETEVRLDKPQQEESNLGDFVADSMIECWLGQVSIAFVSNGGLRSHFIVGDITREDILEVLPFNYTVDKVTMDGLGIKSVLESYASLLCPDASCYAITFLQTSGLRVTYDIRHGNEGNRVTQLLTRIDEWCDINLSQIYNVALPSFFSDGSHGNFGDFITSVEMGPYDNVALEDHIRRLSPINQGLDGRITINYYP